MIGDKQKQIVSMTARTRRETLRRTTIVVLIALGFSGRCARHRQLGIDEVLAALSAQDRKINNFCSRERSLTYDRNGRVRERDTNSIHFYSKPDESILCVYGSSSPCNIYYETGRIVKSFEGGKTSQRTLPDSLFLRDWRSMMLLHLGRADFPSESTATIDRRGTAPRVKFGFAVGDPLKSTWREDGVYDIQIARPNYERAVLRVDVLRGVILEKSVYQLPGGVLSAREVHSDFIQLAGSYLPGKTVYEYGERKVVIYWSDYRANLSVDLKRLNMDEATCERLAALTAPAPAKSARIQPEVATAVESIGVARRNK